MVTPSHSWNVTQQSAFVGVLSYVGLRSVTPDSRVLGTQLVLQPLNVVTATSTRTANRQKQGPQPCLVFVLVWMNLDMGKYK